jgi:hypothetical protein
MSEPVQTPTRALHHEVPERGGDPILTIVQVPFRFRSGRMTNGRMRFAYPEFVEPVVVANLVDQVLVAHHVKPHVNRAFNSRIQAEVFREATNCPCRRF